MSAETQNLFAGWTTYEKVVAGDYMHQRVYIDHLLTVLKGRQPGPTNLLDIGCGDAEPVKPLFADLNINCYIGLDSSDVALEKAAAALTKAGVDYQLHNCDMRQVNQFVSGGWAQLIVASYSLHHLDLEEKQVMLNACADLLSPGGVLAIIDVFRTENEALTHYHNRWADYAQSHYNTLDEEELVELISHVKQEDMPETVPNYLELAEGAGLTLQDQLCAGEEKLNAMLMLGKQN